MKELIELAKEKGFVSEVIGKSAVSKYSDKPYYYLWMCELQKWLKEKHGIDVYTKPIWNKDNSKKAYDFKVVFYHDFEIGGTIIGASDNEAMERGLYEALLTLKL